MTVKRVILRARITMRVFCGVAFLASLFALADTARAAESFLIHDSFTSEPLGRHLEFCVDEKGTLSLDGIVSGTQEARFLPVQSDYPSFGFSRAPHWFRLKARNLTAETAHWLLEYNYPIIDHVEAYIPGTAGYRRHEGGDGIPFDRREVRTRTIVFPVTQPPGSEITIYLRVRSRGSLTVPLTAHTRDSFTAGTQTEMALLFLHYGILLALALYNLFIFVSTKEKSYLYLFLFAASIALYSMVQNGLAFQFLWPRAVRWANISNPFFLFCAVIWALQFSRSFLNLAVLTPRLDRVIKGFFIINLPMLASPFIIDYFYATQLSTVSAGITSCLVLVSGSMLLLKGRRAARFFMLAWAAMLVGTALTSLRAFGLAPSGLISMWGYQFGSSLMVLLLSFGVADQMNVLRREREKALEALGESEHKYRVLVENAREGILVIVDDRPRYANRSFIEISGYLTEEFYRLNVFEDLFPDTPTGRDMVRSRYQARLRGDETPAQYEAQMINKRGEIIDVFISAALITIEGQTGSLSIITNISSLKKAEKTIFHQYEEIQSQYEELEALNEELVSTQNELLDANDSLTREREKLSITLGSIGDAVITTDIQGRITYLNRNAEILAGISTDAAGGQLLHDLLQLSELSGGTILDDPVRHVLDRGGIENLDMVLSRGGRNDTIIEINGALLRDKSGGITGAVLALRDITAKQRLDQELQKMNRLESLGVLAGGIAHDFNNLLTAVLANTSMLRTRASSDEKTQRMFTLIERAGERAVHLTRQLLTFSKGGDPVKKPASVTSLLKECVELTLTGSRALCHIIHETPDKELWPLKFDVDQMSQVFNNILINAIQSMPDGGIITVTLANAGDIPEGLPLSKGRHVKISFTDQGPGIPPEHHAKIFDPYFTTKKRGYGLGLATSYSILKKHGGYIQVSSLPGSGSTFTVYLRSSSHRETVTIPTIQTSPVSSGGRVLIMDDEDIILESLAGLLEQCGYRPATSRDGHEALDMYREAAGNGDPFDLVIMDLTIPGGMGGKEAAVELRKLDPGALCIVTSGYSDDPVLARHRDFGFDGVISKPYNIGDISHAIETLLAGKRSV